MAFYLYILRCSDGTYYTGHTHDIGKRIEEHNKGKAAKYTSGRRPVELVHSESYETRGLAAKREYQIKRWSRARKQTLIDGDIAALKGLQKIDR